MIKLNTDRTAGVGITTGIIAAFVSIAFIVIWIATIVLDMLNHGIPNWILTAVMLVFSVLLVIFFIVAFSLLAKDINDIRYAQFRVFVLRYCFFVSKRYLIALFFYTYLAQTSLPMKPVAHPVAGRLRLPLRSLASSVGWACASLSLCGRHCCTLSTLLAHPKHPKFRPLTSCALFLLL